MSCCDLPGITEDKQAVPTAPSTGQAHLREP
jgi:hypothetical protein